MEILRSIISPLHIHQKIAQDYGFNSKHITCTLLKAYGSNDIYLIIYHKQKFIIKIYSDRKCWSYCLETYLLEAQIIDFLSSNNISVSAPILNIQNSFVSTLETPEYLKYYILFSYVDGDNYQNSKPDYSRLFQLGQNLAFLHNSLKEFDHDHKFPRKVDFEFLIHSPQARINSFAHISKKLSTKLNDLSYELLEEFQKSGYKNFSSGIIHGDMHSGNHKYIKSLKKISFLDFELAGLGWHIYDLAVFRWNLYFSHSKESLTKAWSHFLKGYTSVNELSTEEYNAIFLLVKIRHFFFIGSTFIIYPESTSYNNNEYMNSLVDMFNRFESH